MTGTRRLPLTAVVRLILLFAAIGLLEFAYRYLDDLARGHRGTLPWRLLEEGTGVATALVIVPILLAVARRFPWTRDGWATSLAANAAGALGYTLAHTTLMALSRAALAPLFGMGPYDYGVMLWRYPMEASNDVVAYAVGCALVYYIGRAERARRAEMDAAELRGRLAQLQLENLRLQLHPHFLFNTLNAISSVMYEDVARADAMLGRLSDFLRAVLASADVQTVSVGEELEVERMYVDVMRARLERSVRFDVRVAPDASDARVPFLVLQPLLENAIRHGMTPERDTIAITVDVARDGDETVIGVADDGAGLQAASRRGIGLGNVEARLQALFGAGASFAIASADAGGTQVTLRFPFGRAPLA